MMRSPLWRMSALLFLNVACGSTASTTATQPPPAKPPGEAVLRPQDHTAQSPALGPQTAPSVVFRVATGDRVVTTAIELDDHTVAIGSVDGSLYRFNDSGTLIHAVPTGAPIVSSALAIEGRDTLVANQAGDVMRINKRGAILWRTQLAAPIAANPIHGHDGFAYVSADGIYAIDHGGHVHWHHVEATTIRSTPTPVNDSVVFGTIDGRVVMLRSDGGVAWATRVAAAVTSPVVIDSNGDLLVHAGGQAHTLSREGTVLDSREGNEGRPNTVDRAGNRYFSGADQSIYATRNDDSELWRYNVGANVAAGALLTASGTLIVGADDGTIYALH